MNPKRKNSRSHKNHKRATRRRRLFLEVVEQRLLFVCNVEPPAENVAEDSFVMDVAAYESNSTADALNEASSGTVTVAAEEAPAGIASGSESVNSRLDINGDGTISPNDALLVINHLRNEQAIQHPSQSLHRLPLVRPIEVTRPGPAESFVGTSQLSNHEVIDRVFARSFEYANDFGLVPQIAFNSQDWSFAVSYDLPSPTTGANEAEGDHQSGAVIDVNRGEMTPNPLAVTPIAEGSDSVKAPSVDSTGDDLLDPISKSPSQQLFTSEDLVSEAIELPPEVTEKTVLDDADIEPFSIGVGIPLDIGGEQTTQYLVEGENNQWFALPLRALVESPVHRLEAPEFVYDVRNRGDTTFFIFRLQRFTKEFERLALQMLIPHPNANDSASSGQPTVSPLPVLHAFFEVQDRLTGETIAFGESTSRSAGNTLDFAVPLDPTKLAQFNSLLDSGDMAFQMRYLYRGKKFESGVRRLKLDYGKVLRATQELSHDKISGRAPIFLSDVNKVSRALNAQLVEETVGDDGVIAMLNESSHLQQHFINEFGNFSLADVANVFPDHPREAIFEHAKAELETATRRMAENVGLDVSETEELVEKQSSGFDLGFAVGIPGLPNILSSDGKKTGGSNVNGSGNMSNEDIQKFIRQVDETTGFRWEFDETQNTFRLASIRIFSLAEAGDEGRLEVTQRVLRRVGPFTSYLLDSAFGPTHTADSVTESIVGASGEFSLILEAARQLELPLPTVDAAQTQILEANSALVSSTEQLVNNAVSLNGNYTQLREAESGMRKAEGIIFGFDGFLTRATTVQIAFDDGEGLKGERKLRERTQPEMQSQKQTVLRQREHSGKIRSSIRQEVAGRPQLISVINASAAKVGAIAERLHSAIPEDELDALPEELLANPAVKILTNRYNALVQDAKKSLRNIDKGIKSQLSQSAQATKIVTRLDGQQRSLTSSNSDMAYQSGVLEGSTKYAGTYFMIMRAIDSGEAVWARDGTDSRAPDGGYSALVMRELTAPAMAKTTQNAIKSAQTQKAIERDSKALGSVLGKLADSQASIQLDLERFGGTLEELSKVRSDLAPFLTA